MKKLLLLAIFSFFGLAAQAQCEAQFQCTYTFIMSDSYGDGWNGNTMVISQNGNDIATIGATFDDGNNSTASVLLCTGVPFQIRWNLGEGNTYPDEVGLNVMNNFQQTVFALAYQSQLLANSIIYTGNVNCISSICSPPILPVAQATSVNSVFIQWNAQFDQNQWEVLELPDGLPFPNASMIGTATTVNSFTYSGLDYVDAYNYYVRSVCSGGEKSVWTGSSIFYSELFDSGRNIRY
ncbi:hypothetical protein [Flavobacterium sp. 3HN19-14]|uniref:hypothetical protein n=1 Tax=Flavobacterium sp. 3HN19-14 TaxID=3448133 RepID=UPI003EE3F402